jgi:poly-beta-1,6-N-acetyl-D-glucosamine synthase
MTAPSVIGASIGGDLVRWTILVCLVYLLAVYGAYAFMLVVSGIEQVVRSRGRRFESFARTRESTLTIPVSIVAPVYNEAPVVVAAVQSFVGVDYPEFEVIVVNDGSTDGTLEALKTAFGLELIEHLHRVVYPAGPIRGVYTSRAHPGLKVIDKENGGKADALNCGLNLARYRYVCGVDGDTILARSALLDGMRLVLSDPATIIGVTGHIAISGTPEASFNSEGKPSRLDPGSLLAFQHLDYLRSFYNNRLAWTRLNTMLCAVGAFQIWRRDVLEEAGGFSTRFTCEDIELTFRLHEAMRREHRPYRILSLADTVGATEGPHRVKSLIAQRERWQRVIMETVFSYRKLFLNPRYGTVGMIGVPFFVLSEVIAPVFEMLALIALLAGLALHLVELGQVMLTVTAITFANGIFTTTAVGLEDRTSRAYRKTDLLRMIALGLVDLIVYRPLICYARAQGTWRFLRGDKSWHKFQRNDRAATGTAG